MSNTWKITSNLLVSHTLQPKLRQFQIQLLAKRERITSNRPATDRHLSKNARTLSILVVVCWWTLYSSSRLLQTLPIQSIVISQSSKSSRHIFLSDIPGSPPMAYFEWTCQSNASPMQASCTEPKSPFLPLVSSYSAPEPRAADPCQGHTRRAEQWWRHRGAHVPNHCVKITMETL